MTGTEHWLDRDLKRLRQEVKAFPQPYRMDAAEMIVTAWVQGKRLQSTDAPDLLKMFREAEYGG